MSKTTFENSFILKRYLQFKKAQDEHELQLVLPNLILVLPKFETQLVEALGIKHFRSA
jgi:hypothetical protein